MTLVLNRQRRTYYRPPASKKGLSLSTYFPKGTHYFYGYPAGEDSGFLNLVPPSVEELVAVRAVSCAGDHVSVIGFAATHYPFLSKELLEKFNLPTIPQEHLVLLPEHINASIKGAERNRVIKSSLLNLIGDNNLVMAQPYSSKDMNSIYQIPSKLIRYLNDKNHMNQYINSDLLPQRLGTFKNGDDFVSQITKLPLPFVVKASSSSCGDGVYICLNQSHVEAAIQNLKNVKGNILVEQFILAQKNFGIHFGIPSDIHKPIDFLGVNEQLTTAEGEFIGGIIESADIPNELLGIKRYLSSVVLPSIRDMGWYGVGGFDILQDTAGRFYFIDCNFRMTGMSAYHFLVANNVITAPLISFSGEFVGTQEDLEAQLLPYGGKENEDRFLQLIALSRQGTVWNFNASLSFDDDLQLFERIELLKNSGVQSKALDQIVLIAQ